MFVARTLSLSQCYESQSVLLLQVIANCCWLLLYSDILHSQTYSLHSHVIVLEWITFYSTFLTMHHSGVLTVAGATWNCRHLSVFWVHHTTMHHVTSCKATYVAVTCHPHFWQNDRGLLRATAVTWGWNGCRNESAQKVDPGKENSPTAPAGIWAHDLLITSLAL